METATEQKTTSAFKTPVPFLAASAALVIAAVLVERAWKRSTQIHHSLPTEADTPLNRKWGEGTRDIVEQASWESFPASDSPAW